MYTHKFHVKFITCPNTYLFLFSFICIFVKIFAAPQQLEMKYDKQAEIPDQFEKHEEIKAPPIHEIVTNLDREQSTINPELSPETTATNYVIEMAERTTAKTHIEVVKDTPTFTTRFYTMVAIPIQRFVASPKVNTVLRNIGTCVVNGAMEIISHFFPTPLMPLIASAAGMIIPFEPVVMLKERMPVTSYRRAIKTAVDGFMGTFDQYKAESEDPYMTKKFYRRFMDDDNNAKTKSQDF